jgi:hypothetical protein
MAHGIPPDEQIIEGWTDSFEKQAKKYAIKKYHLKSKS